MGRAMPGRSGIGGRLLAGITLAAFLTAPVPAAMAQDGTPAAKSDATKSDAAKSESKPDASP